MAWIVPQKNRNTLFLPGEHGGYRDRVGPLRDAGPAPFLLGAPHCLDASRDLLLHADGGRIFVVRGLLAGQPSVSSLRVSWASTITSILIHGEHAYLGGSSPFGLLLGVLRLGEPLAFQPLELPRGFSAMASKSIDGFALFKNRLIAVDDVVFPWYFLVYDLDDPARPRPLKARMFSFGHVASVAHGGDLIALFQTTGSRGRVRRAVQLFGADTLEVRATLLGHEGAPEWEHARGVPSIAFHDDHLLFADGERGLGLAPASAFASPAPAPVQASSFRHIQTPEGPVVGVVPADPGRVFAVVRSRAGLSGVLVSV